MMLRAAWKVFCSVFEYFGCAIEHFICGIDSDASFIALPAQIHKNKDSSLSAPVFNMGFAKLIKYRDMPASGILAFIIFIEDLLNYYLNTVVNLKLCFGRMALPYLRCCGFAAA